MKQNNYQARLIEEFKKVYMSNKPIYVTRPFLPPLEEYTELLKGIWESGILTHGGKLLQRFESELCQKLNIQDIVVVGNGTIAIQMAIKALELKGEIITTPFTWVATVSAIKWEGCTPVFCDINPETLNIDSAKIESLITNKTVAIMPVHVFGNPCEVEAIHAIAQKHGLKVIYDAAHAIGSTFHEKSLLCYGDISTTSLHATKIINTAEGGACFTTNDELLKKLKRIRFFGHNDNKEIVEDGINGKLTEFQAALGVANMKYYDAVFEDRKRKCLLYKSLLSAHNHLIYQKHIHGEHNYSYFPVIFENEHQVLNVEKALNAQQIFPRRYFYPTVNTFSKIVEYMPTPIAEDISKRILCLPLSFSLQDEDMEEICKILGKAL
ncbi:MAG: DegT/DnrJ/EryC1/StrS family aminotransferase [Ferruginibacter sp.]|nr:DegT/DnrJ/EryC1/StrS family aminotransferase [Ferruginibacter sp.]